MNPHLFLWPCPFKGLCKILRFGCWLPGVMSDSPVPQTLGRLTQRIMIPRGDWLRAVWYPGEIDSAQYDTPGRLTPCSMIPRGDWLSAVLYPGEIDSAQYDTPGRLTQRSMIPRGDWLAWYYTERFRKIWITSEILTKIENILTHRSVARQIRMMKKTEGGKSHWAGPLNGQCLKIFYPMF